MTSTPHFPGRPTIDAYGNGGFRFADMSHIGAILCLPGGVFASAATDPDALAQEALAGLRTAGFAPQTVLLVGTGPKHIFLTPDTHRAFADAGVGLDVMNTGAACRTWNILLAEKRAVAVALLPVP